MTKTQWIGIGIIAIGSIVYYLFEHDILLTISGVLCAFGLALILKLITFKNQNLPE